MTASSVWFPILGVQSRLPTGDLPRRSGKTRRELACCPTLFQRTGSAVVPQGSRISKTSIGDGTLRSGTVVGAPFVRRQPLTSYSVLLSGPRATVIATWPGKWADHSAKVTTLTDAEQASELAHLLARLSEGAWDAAAWLDTHPAIEAGIAALVEQLQGPAENIDDIHLATDGYRHTDQWSFDDIKDLLAKALPAALNTLTRAQRLTLADELAIDAASRGEALQLLPTGHDPDAATSRSWQMCEVTRSLRNGQTGPLPEGAAAWLVRSWGPDHSPAERWGARDRLVRIEQLVAACQAHGGRAKSHDDPLLAHLVVPVPNGRSTVDDEVFYVAVHAGNHNSWDTDVFAPMRISRSGGANGASETLGDLDPSDDDGFARLLGDWTRLVAYRR